MQTAPSSLPLTRAAACRAFEAARLAGETYPLTYGDIDAAIRDMVRAGWRVIRSPRSCDVTVVQRPCGTYIVIANFDGLVCCDVAPFTY